jgi:transposase
VHPGCLWARKGQRPALTANSGRHRYSVLGGYCVSGEYVGVETDGMVNAQTVIRWIDRLEAAFPEAECITVYVDNARYFHARLVKAHLHGKRVRFVYLPAYSPNLNLIERLWKFCKKTVLIKFYATYAQFTQAIDAFFQNLGQYRSELGTLMAENFEILRCR